MSEDLDESDNVVQNVNAVEDSDYEENTNEYCEDVGTMIKSLNKSSDIDQSLC